MPDESMTPQALLIRRPESQHYLPLQHGIFSVLLLLTMSVKDAEDKNQCFVGFSKNKLIYQAK